jgi:hypothetical protein
MKTLASQLPTGENKRGPRNGEPGKSADATAALMPPGVEPGLSRG